MLALNHSDLTLRVGSIAVLCIYSAVVLLLAGILLLRFIRLAKERRRRNVTEIWRPLLAQCVVEVPETLPALKSRDHLVFLYLWNHCYESVRGDARTLLNELARRTKTDQFATELLRSGRLRRQLLAIVTLGHLQERSVWNELEGTLQADNAFLSLVAAKALLNIDAQAAVPLLIPVISRRKDWSPLKVVAMFEAVGADLAAETIAKAACQAAPEIGARLIRHLAATQSQHGLPPLRALLRESSPSDDVLAACLFLFGECSDPRDMATVRAHISHPTWYVRLQAASALGKMGVEEDEALLIGLLDDEHWWVRYRAAEALSNLPWMTADKMTRLCGALSTIEAHEHMLPFMAQSNIRKADSLPTVPPERDIL
ncbi:MAG: HEAT repeat domain-containing protein [Nitrospira sp.]|nr:HEAT repeat domain-containing protein [Nitrospira sp.]